MTHEQKRRLRRDGLRYLAVVAVLAVAALYGRTDWWPAIGSAFTCASVLAVRLIDQHQERKATHDEPAHHERTHDERTRDRTACRNTEPHPSLDFR